MTVGMLCEYALEAFFVILAVCELSTGDGLGSFV